VAKVTGRAKYAGDLVLPGMLEGAIVRAPHAHARIVSVDPGPALARPGVVAVLTRDDLDGLDPYYGPLVRDRPLVAIDRVRFAGEPVAAVAALDRATAEAAAALVRVEYEPLPAALGLEAALAEGAPLVHERTYEAGDEGRGARPVPGTNVLHRERLVQGDVERGFAEADVVVEDTFTFPMVAHYALEPHTAVARWDHEGLTVWTSAQHPFLVRDELARIFRLPLARVRVVVPYVGGGFGSKSYTKIEPLVAALARKAGRPVRVAQSLSESVHTTRRHAARCRIRTAARRDGTLLAREAEIWLDTGAYADNGPQVARQAAQRVVGPYRFPHLRIEASAVYTHTVPAGSFRSIGAPQAIWAGESQMDILAERLGMDPLELRLKNLLRRGETVRSGLAPLDADLATGLRRTAEALGWGAPPRGAGRGLGLALGIMNAGAFPVSTALVRLHADGSASVLAGTTEIGQGARTVLAQIAAEELALPLARVAVESPDTAAVPFDRSTGSSRSTTLMGLAVQRAAREVREALVRLGAARLGVAPEAVALEDGWVVAGDRRASYAEAIAAHFGLPGGELVGRGYVRPAGGRPQSPVFWEVGIGGAEVEVDGETGEIRLRRYVSAADVGLAVNPRECEGQDEGAAMMGIGHTLFEALRYEGEQPVNPNLVDYRVPRMSDLPDDFVAILVEHGDGPGPYGAKGMGEGGVVSVAPAVASALARATGVRVRELPLTPERVWRALRARGDPERRS
ncbi:MAG TPA: xanthine dehydrogenase family protein molybdopterin-binding subunit, partial [Thermodesulfobacteriota bacterium]|nr:xanthine dehydrogenase family protein molybdopterin-binding subunit [Thermodesulfobacteriota bacterium]